jgi:hypothetical protein
MSRDGEPSPDGRLSVSPTSTRLGASEDALTAAEASLKQAHTRFDAADDQVAAAENALHASHTGRVEAREGGTDDQRE